MHVLITGGAGFLGLHISHYLNKKNWKITVYDIADFPEDEYPNGVSYIRGDVRDKKSLGHAMKGVDVVIHAAAALPLRPEDDIRTTTVDGTRNVCEQALSSKIKQVIYISSTAVYGVPRKHPVYETDERVGVGPYGESKIAAEDICRGARKKGLIVTTIRPKTFLGTHRLGVFEILFDWIKDNKKIPVVGSGNNRYQLLEVDDLVEAIYLSLMHTKKDEVNTEFNVGAREFRTVKEDLHDMFTQVGSSSHIMPTPAAPIKTALFIFEQLHLSPLYKWVYATADKDSFVSVDKITKTIGWKPKHSNTQALVKAYKWYEKNYDEIKSRPAGTTHTVGWKQGILGVFKKFL
jgi:nucleoside-diphosphate-sugar epimerase